MVQLIDLDAAMGTGTNDSLVRRVSGRLAAGWAAASDRWSGPAS